MTPFIASRHLRSVGGYYQCLLEELWEKNIKDERLPTCKKFLLRSPIIDGWFTTKGYFDGIGGTKVLIPSSGKVPPQVFPSDSYSYFIILYVCCKITNFFFQASLPLICTLQFKVVHEAKEAFFALFDNE